MSLNEDANLDPGQVEDLRDRRGRGGRLGFPLPTGRGGGTGLPLPGGKGGLIGLAVLVLLGLLFGGSATGVLPGVDDLGGLGDQPSESGGSLAEACAVENQDRFDDPACRNLLYVNSIQAYWQTALPEYFGAPYQPTTTRYFSESVDTACGFASSGAGPFYCPGDRHVYLDLTFYDELARRFGANGEFAQAYVLAHEYGHHVQTLLGIESQVRRAQQRDPGNANQYSVLMELQADCLAGSWANGAADTRDQRGQPLFEAVTEQAIAEALQAAAAVGDDAIQQRTTGEVNPEAFTHGSSAQRQQWFQTGYSTGDPRRCDTFAAG
ncbi:MAG TPA: neutral zinc metallopeptidase [Natronosporangium sp.]